MTIKKVLYVASEVMPYAKSGGLADVAAAFPAFLKTAGVDVRIVMPYYGFIEKQKKRFKIEAGVTSMSVKLAGVEYWCAVRRAKTENKVPVYFIQYDHFFDRDGIYNDSFGEFGDNPIRFAFFCKAALQLCKDFEFFPDIIHCNDWMTAFLPSFLKLLEDSSSPLFSAASVLTLHNIAYQGKYSADFFGSLGIDYSYFNSFYFEDFGMLNILKGGIQFADIITTVSPSYAKEITESPGGNGLESFLKIRSKDLFGILNGIDYKVWNPKTDKLIPSNYTDRSLKRKQVSKNRLQKTFGLEISDKPLFGLVSRLTWQKGINLIIDCVRPVLHERAVQFVFLGNGEKWLEDELYKLNWEFPKEVGVFIGYDENLSHLVEAGSDFFLMPSLFEPCGLNQLYSLKYGTTPIVRNVGGLSDTVEDFDPEDGSGSGFVFEDFDVVTLRDKILSAIDLYTNEPDKLLKLRKYGMKRDFSWEKSVEKYLEVYQIAKNKRAEKISPR